MHDSAFSFMAVQMLLAGRQRFTLLPATIVEIRRFIQRAFNQLEPRITSIESLSPSATEVELSRLRADIEAIVSPVSRMALVVLALLNSSAFVTPVELLKETSPTVDQYRNWREALQSLRPSDSRRSANEIDAHNLAMIHAFNRRDQGTLVQLLTRTRACRVVGSGTAEQQFALSEVEIEARLRIRQRVGSGQFNVVLAPDAFMLWHIIQRDVPDDALTMFKEARLTQKLCQDVESELSQLLVDLDHDRDGKGLLDTLERLSDCIGNPRFAAYIEKFRGLYERDAERPIRWLFTAR